MIYKYSGRIALSLLIFSLLAFEKPKSWFVAGSRPSNYRMGLDTLTGQSGKKTATIQSKSRKKSVSGFGTLMQTALPGNYLGRRVRMSGMMKTKDVAKWAGFWFRVDGPNGKTLSFDNMHARKLQGTTDWARYEIVLNVPLHAVNLAYGALLSGSGQIWFDDMRFEVVDGTVPVTGENHHSIPLDHPDNLDFEE